MPADSLRSAVQRGLCYNRRITLENQTKYRGGGEERELQLIQATRVVSGSLVSDFKATGIFPFLTAGNCWLVQGKNGRCQQLYMAGMSREECCRGGRLGTSWTEEDVPNHTLFRWTIFSGGAPNCIPCKGRST